MKYCAWQDRCHQEVTRKLLSLNIYGEELDDIIMTLLEEDFLNESRFAESFVRGKFHYKQWGRKKIVKALQNKNISPYLVKASLKEIDPEEYRATLRRLAIKHLKGVKDYHQRMKTTRYLFNKGYEPELIREVLDQLY